MKTSLHITPLQGKRLGRVLKALFEVFIPFCWLIRSIYILSICSLYTSTAELCKILFFWIAVSLDFRSKEQETMFKSRNYLNFSFDEIHHFYLLL